MYSGFAFFVMGMRAINAAVAFWATMILWTALLECVNMISYIYAIQRTPGMFLAELGSTGTRDTILTHGAIMDEVAMISGLMGYMAIVTYALARTMVANQGSQITGAFSGAIGGLGLSAFAVRSAAQGKIETPLGSVGPDGVQSYSHISDKINKMSPTGVGENIGAGTNGSWHEKSVNGRIMGFDFKASEGNAVATLGMDGNVSFANANNGIAGEVANNFSNTARINHSNAIKDVKTSSTDFAHSIQNFGGFVQTGSQNFKSSEISQKAQAYQQNITAADIASGQVLKQMQQAKSYEEKAAIMMGASASFAGFKVGAEGQIAGSNTKMDAVQKQFAQMAQYMQGETETYNRTNTKASENNFTGSIQWQNGIKEMSDNAKKYSQAVQKEETWAKISEFASSNSATFKQNLDTVIAQDYVNRYGEYNGIQMWAHDASNQDKYKQIMQNYVNAAMNGDQEKLNALFNKADANISGKLGASYNAATGGTSNVWGDNTALFMNEANSPMNDKPKNIDKKEAQKKTEESSQGANSLVMDPTIIEQLRHNVGAQWDYTHTPYTDVNAHNSAVLNGLYSEKEGLITPNMAKEWHDKQERIRNGRDTSDMKSYEKPAGQQTTPQPKEQTSTPTADLSADAPKVQGRGKEKK